MLFLLPTGWPTSFFSVLLFFSFSQKIVFVWGCESAGFTAPVSSSCRFPQDLWLLHSLGSLPTCVFKVRLSHPLFTNSYSFSLAHFSVLFMLCWVNLLSSVRLFLVCQPFVSQLPEERIPSGSPPLKEIPTLRKFSTNQIPLVHCFNFDLCCVSIWP